MRMNSPSILQLIDQGMVCCSPPERACRKFGLSLQSRMSSDIGQLQSKLLKSMY